MRRHEITHGGERAVKHLQTALFHLGKAVLSSEFGDAPDFPQTGFFDSIEIYAHNTFAYALRLLLFSWAQHGGIYVSFMTFATNGSYAQKRELEPRQMASSNNVNAPLNRRIYNSIG